MRAVVGSFLVAACGFSGDGQELLDDGAPAPDARRDGSPPVIDASPIDASPPDARPCPAAPADCAPFRCGETPSCYYVCSARGYNAARDRCTTAGLGCLATIDDAAENACIAANTVPMFPDLVWFGFFQDPSGSEPGGRWGWLCGASSFVAPNWGSGEPNDEDGEDCCAMGGGAAWIDGDCGTVLRYVCEIVP